MQLTATTHRTAAGLALVASLGTPLGLGACGSRSAEQGRERRMLAALTEARDAVCACRELACAEAAEARLAEYLLQRVDSLKKIAPARGDAARAALAAEATRLDGELRTCRRRLEQGHEPGTPN